MNEEEKQYWFRPKRFGYGMEPISWQGWLATLVFVGAIIALAYFIGLTSESQEPTFDQIFGFISGLIMLIILFMRVAKDKCKGELKWNWGKRKNNENNQH